MPFRATQRHIPRPDSPRRQDPGPLASKGLTMSRRKGQEERFAREAGLGRLGHAIFSIASGQFVTRASRLATQGYTDRRATRARSPVASKTDRERSRCGNRWFCDRLRGRWPKELKGARFSRPLRRVPVVRGSDTFGMDPWMRPAECLSPSPPALWNRHLHSE